MTQYFEYKYKNIDMMLSAKKLNNLSSNDLRDVYFFVTDQNRFDITKTQVYGHHKFLWLYID